VAQVLVRVHGVASVTLDLDGGVGARGTGRVDNQRGNNGRALHNLEDLVGASNREGEGVVGADGEQAAAVGIIGRIGDANGAGTSGGGEDGIKSAVRENQRDEEVIRDGDRLGKAADDKNNGIAFLNGELRSGERGEWVITT
jgi:hypothetical protein